MKLICSTCGNYVHFEANVEMHQPVRVTGGGIQLESCDKAGYNHQGRSIRMGVEELVSYCVHNDLETLDISADGGGAKNRFITCARCGSASVTIPYCPWTPAIKYSTMEEELTDNQQEYAWLRKERRKHEIDLSGLP